VLRRKVLLVSKLKLTQEIAGDGKDFAFQRKIAIPVNNIVNQPDVEIAVRG
jgi:hypothetical protein